MAITKIHGAIIAGVLATLATGGAAHAQIASALLQEGRPLPGVPGETVTFINNPAVNHVGGYAVSINTDGSGTTLSRGWGHATGGPGAVLQTEATIGDLEQTSFESFIGVSNAGLLAYSAISNDLGSGQNGLDGAWLRDQVLLNELDQVLSLPGQYSVFNSRVGVTADGQPYWVGGISNVQGGATQNRVLFLGVNPQPVLMGGDPIVGVAEQVTTATSGIDFDVRFSALGTHYILPVGLVAAASSDIVMVIDGTALTPGGGVMREGLPVPPAIGGLPGELWSSFDLVGVTESGQWFVTGDTSAAVAVDEFVVLDGLIELREGDTLPLAGPMNVTVSGAIESGYLNDDGDWAVTWDVNGPTGNVEALILDSEIVLLEGDQVDWNNDGVIDAADDGATVTDFTGISTVALGDRNGQGVVKVYFTADVSLLSGPVTEGFFCLPISLAGNPCPADLDGNNSVGFSDLLVLLGMWGPCPGCPADLDGDNSVGFSDLLVLLGAWGPC